MFGRRNKQSAPVESTASKKAMQAANGDATTEHDVPETDTPADGPYDSTEVPVADGESDGRLDLGSVRLPLLDGAQLQVEMDEVGGLRFLHLLTEVGRITVSAFAAPRSAGMWHEVVGELAQSLKDDGSVVRFENGPWGREVIGVGEAATLRFVGVDGPRWMVRCVAAGPDESQEPLAELARSVLQDTVVVRGVEPMPVRSPLPVTLPELLAQQLEQARAQHEAQQGAGEPD
ncbi:MAG: DUF3710 domain-containing protein [Actinomycetota bacterium]|nr:DUF3710 domain-containing protein [Actinomycetota bacterium]